MLLGDVYIRMGFFSKAARVLSEALCTEMGVGKLVPHRVVALMRVFARYFRARGHASMVCSALRVVTNILDEVERDQCIRATAHVDLAFAEAVVGEKAAAVSRLSAAVRCLRKRKRDSYAMSIVPGASRCLAKLVVPRRRLRGRWHSEDVEPRLGTARSVGARA